LKQTDHGVLDEITCRRGGPYVFLMGAVLPVFTGLANVEEFPIMCSIVEATDAEDDIGEKIRIALDGVVAKRGKDEQWKPRHGGFAIAFKNSAGEMRWIGYGYGDRALDKTIRLDAVWAKHAISSSRGGYIAAYTETVHKGIQNSKLVSECEIKQPQQGSAAVK
jgi:hypothetical protein